jgi:hypothetical protein
MTWLQMPRLNKAALRRRRLCQFFFGNGSILQHVKVVILVILLTLNEPIHKQIEIRMYTWHVFRKEL